MASNRHIPEDITIKILSGLPVKSLIRFLCVCKRWSLLINNPTFISRHLTQTSLNSKGGNLLITSRTYECESDPYIDVFADGAFDAPIHSQKVLPSLVLNGHIYIYSNNGLLCIDAFRHHSYVIWNPATRQKGEIPKHDLTGYTDISNFLGFGVVPETNDYKLIGISQYLKGNEEYEEMEIDHIQIHSKYTTWREIDAPALTAGLIQKTMACKEWTQIQVKGVLYWIADSWVDGYYCYLITGFDIDEEKLVQLAMPPTETDKIYACLLTEIEGSLALITSDSKGKGGISQYNQVWTMNDRPGKGGGWIMKFRLRHLTVDWVWKNSLIALKRPQSSDDNDDEFLLSLQRLDDDQSLFVPEIKNFFVPRKNHHRLQIHNYVESLFHV